MTIDEIQALIAQGHFSRAHAELRPLVDNQSVSSWVRASANNLMSVVVSAEPTYDEAGDFGLSFLRRALSEIPHFGAALNIVGCYGEGPTMHQDSHLLLLSIHLLENEYSSRLSKIHLDLIQSKKEVLKRLTWPLASADVRAAGPDL